MIAWFAKNDVAANILLVVIMLAGLYVMKTQVPVDMFPEIEIRNVNVSVSLPRCLTSGSGRRHNH